MGKLQSALRNVALTTKLPCDSSWYSSDIIEYGLNNEVEIYPMTHSDEILMHNPDALFSNNAVSKIITSCCPNIKNVGKLLNPDIEPLLLAIKIASIGDEIEIYNVCPQCFETYNKASDEEKAKLLEDKKVNIEPQTFIFDARHCLETMSPLQNNLYVNITDKVKVNLKPLTLAESTEYELNDFNIKNTIQHYIMDSKEYEENAKMFSDIENWKKNREKNEDFNELLIKLDEIVKKMIKTSIKSIEYNGEILTSDEDFDDLLHYVNSDKFELIKSSVDEANKSRLNKKIHCQCKYCGYEWDDENVNFNFSNFFGKGS